VSEKTGRPKEKLTGRYPKRRERHWINLQDEEDELAQSRSSWHRRPSLTRDELGYLGTSLMCKF